MEDFEIGVRCLHSKKRCSSRLCPACPLVVIYLSSGSISHVTLIDRYLVIINKSYWRCAFSMISPMLILHTPSNTAICCRICNMYMCGYFEIPGLPILMRFCLLLVELCLKLLRICHYSSDNFYLACWYILQCDRKCKFSRFKLMLWDSS